MRQCCRFIEVEPYWNVNSDKYVGMLWKNTLEVEPYWNVNFIIDDKREYYDWIEVEPYWNVNRSEHS